jgi:hypothetical protein
MGKCKVGKATAEHVAGPSWPSIVTTTTRCEAAPSAIGLNDLAPALQSLNCLLIRTLLAFFMVCGTLELRVRSARLLVARTIGTASLMTYSQFLPIG